MDLLEEGEQWEAVKAWLRQNGLAIVAGALIGTLGLLGWRWFQGHQEAQRLAANVAYEKLLAAFDSGDVTAWVKQLDAFHKDYGDSAYSAPADLAAARVYVSRNEFDKAAERLRSVADTAKDPQLRIVARLRLARVQIAQNKPDDALSTLGTGDVGGFQSVFAEIRGDARLAKGDRPGALREYETARATRADSSQPPGADAGDLLELKINDLRSEALAPVPAPKG